MRTAPHPRGRQPRDNDLAMRNTLSSESSHQRDVRWTHSHTESAIRRPLLLAGSAWRRQPEYGPRSQSDSANHERDGGDAARRACVVLLALSFRRATIREALAFALGARPAARGLQTKDGPDHDAHHADP